MKKLFVIPLLVTYLLAFTGIVVKAHYCGSNLVSWSMYAEPEMCGGCEKDTKEAKKKDCCSDKVISEKIDQEQNFAQYKYPVLQDLYLPAEPIHYTVPACVCGNGFCFITSNRSNAPPGNWQYIPLYKLHNSFTYYG